MAHQPADTLRNRSFVGLIIAQFLAGFNDQFIHAAAMFYAIRTEILNEAQAISLMPILFYAPWAIFCTVAGFCADRFSKRWGLVIWKLAEIGIAVIALSGFYIFYAFNSPIGPWLVMATVFLMGTHAAFFAPAKYGAMPEILQPHVLSKGNGILESTTFLAAIFGTVAGGLLSHVFRGQEYMIGWVLLGLALLGAVFSLLIDYLPPANPTRLFPTNLFKPLWNNLGVLFRSRPLALAVLGIAFFIFMVAYMRATMYMHGETRNPKWDEFKTSLVVATVALGVGLGSPLAGFLSGGKIELGLVPLGCIGMIIGALFAGFAINVTPVLITGLIIIGFFSGFYMVPLYTLLQHRAPKASKGDLVATSNFINVTGAMAASLLFFILVQAGRGLGITPEVKQQDHIAQGTLDEIKKDDADHPVLVVIRTKDGDDVTFRAKSVHGDIPTDDENVFLDRVFEQLPEYLETIEFDDATFEIGGLRKGEEVIVSSYEMLRRVEGVATPQPVRFYKIRQASKPLSPVYNNERLPFYLFLGAGGMTLLILILLVRKLPDFFVRTVFWARSLGRYRIKVFGMHNLPTSGPVILATNCDDLDSSLEVLAATDRHTHFILLEKPDEQTKERLLRYLARRSGFTMVPAGRDDQSLWTAAVTHANQALKQHDLVAVTMDGDTVNGEDRFLSQIPWQSAPVLPVFCGPLGVERRIRVVFGNVLQPEADFAQIRQSIRDLGQQIRLAEADGTQPVIFEAH